MMNAEDMMRQALWLFQVDPPDNDFQRGYLEGLKVFANEAMGFPWSDPLMWGDGGQPLETKAVKRKFEVIDGGKE